MPMAMPTPASRNRAFRMIARCGGEFIHARTIPAGVAPDCAAQPMFSPSHPRHAPRTTGGLGEAGGGGGDFPPPPPPPRGRRPRLRGPADVLPQRPAPRAAQIARALDALADGRAVRRLVGEEPPRDHVDAVALRG